MSTCRDCRYWTAWADDNDRRHINPPDGLVIGESVWGTCGREWEPNPPMFTNDASEYFSALRTRAEFSCSAWEARADD